MCSAPFLDVLQAHLTLQEKGDVEDPSDAMYILPHTQVAIALCVLLICSYAPWYIVGVPKHS